MVENDNVPLPVVNNYHIIRNIKDNPMILVDCIINPRFLRCFGLDVNINKVYNEFCIAHKLLIKCTPIDRKMRKFELSKIYLVDTYHPNAKKIIHKHHFSYDMLNEIDSVLTYQSNPNYSLYELCKDPFKTYSKEHLDIELMKLINDISYWNFDDGYWFDLSMISIDIGEVDMLYDQIKEKMISAKKAKKRFKIAYTINQFRKPLAKLMKLKDKDVVNGFVQFGQMLGAI